MAIARADQITRALALAGERGPVFVGESLRGHATSCADAKVAVVSVREVDASGRGLAESHPEGMPVIGVLEEGGRFRAALDRRTTERVALVVFERGVLEIGAHGFVLLEVEDGRSAREVQAELGLPMLADARLTVFGGDRN